MSLKQESQNKVFDGTLTKYSFKSEALGGLEAKFNVFLPKEADKEKVPVLYYLAGLTCTEDTGPQKGSFFSSASRHSIALIFPDTSPRGAGIKGEDDDWDFGTGAGFYLNATKGEWKKNYRMEECVVREIPGLVEKEGLNIDGSRMSIFGHSMGGHGALSLYLRNPGLYKSSSAFAPICNPTSCPWGQKAFTSYLSSPTEHAQYDSTLLLPHFPKDKELAIKIDYGDADKFLKDGQLLPEKFEEAVRAEGREGEVEVRRREGYDHSYFFISTFASEHIDFHAKHLKA